MYHKNNLGAFAGAVAPFADIQGYVPEAGDSWRDMQFDTAGAGFTDAQWAEHVAAAVEATIEANADAASWNAQ